MLLKELPQKIKSVCISYSLDFAQITILYGTNGIGKSSSRFFVG